MYYKSTRDSSLRLESAEAIAQGISTDGGLFVPETIPTVTMSEIRSMAPMTYAQRAAFIFSKYLTDYTEAELRYCTESAYTTKAFDTENITELVKLFDGTYLLELWHGPTCAFKDMALQVLPYFLTTAAKKLGKKEKIVILVATSGDTGKAALEGFRDVEGTEIIVFYPAEGVSPMQKLQMVSQEGENVSVAGVQGNFDDCQSGVKAIFTDRAVNQTMSEHGFAFSSANSINWGRLLPQIVYYISTYVNLAEKGDIAYGDKINVCVPTGNFGNILAAYYAKEMGLPIGKLICASNQNKVLTDFLRTGVYDRNRPFYTSMSPSMDILISSNVERLLYLLCGEDDAEIRTLFQSLATIGRYEVSEAVKEKLSEIFYAGYCDEESTLATISETYTSDGYVVDPHTAVAVHVYQTYRNETGDTTPTVIASTASPYKFSGSVLKAIGAPSEGNEFDQVAALSAVTKTDVPVNLAALSAKEVRFPETIDRENLGDYVRQRLGIN